MSTYEQGHSLRKRENVMSLNDADLIPLLPSSASPRDAADGISLLMVQDS